jgi:hypothetical protein
MLLLRWLRRTLVSTVSLCFNSGRTNRVRPERCL